LRHSWHFKRCRPLCAKAFEAHRLQIEFTLLLVAIQGYLYFPSTRVNIRVTLWGSAFYALMIVLERHIVSWRTLWYGAGWSAPQRKIAALRFCISTALILIFTWFVMPDRLFSFAV
jgi:hypothetical protein